MRMLLWGALEACLLAFPALVWHCMPVWQAFQAPSLLALLHHLVTAPAKPQPAPPNPPQDLNPLPFPALAANCAGWVAYSFVIDDALVLWPNMCGYLLALFYLLSW